MRIFSRLLFTASVSAGIAGFGVASAAPSTPTVMLSDSVQSVPDAPSTDPSRPNRPYIVRNALKTSEIAAPLEFEVTLKMRHLAELQARLATGERISAQEMAEKYNPTATDYAKITAWLTANGFEITRQDSNRLAVFAKASIGHIQTALKVHFARVSADGQEYSSALSAPSAPAEISPLLIASMVCNPMCTCTAIW